MNRNFFILLLIILLIPLASADLNDGLEFWFEFSGSNYSNATGGLQGSPSAVPTFTASGKVGKAIAMDGTNDGMFTNYNDTSIFNTEYTIAFWMKTTDTSGDYFGVSQASPKTNIRWIASSGNIRFLQEDQDSQAYDSTPTGAINSGTWKHIVLRVNVTGQYFNYTLDGAVISNTTFAGLPDNVDPTLATLGIGGRVLGGAFEAGKYVNAQYDEFALWDRHLTDAEVGELYNGGVGIGAPNASGGGGGGGLGDTINITGTTPLNNESFNSLIVRYNATITASSVYNCSLYINNILNSSLNNNINSTLNNTVAFNVTYQTNNNLNQNYSINCTDSSFYPNSTVNQVFVDLVDPTINFLSPSKTNKSIEYNSFTTNIVGTDTNLYSYELNLSNQAGQNIFHLLNTSLTGFNTVTINHSIDIINTSGSINANLRLCDGHTAKKISFGFVNSASDRMFFDNVIIKSNDLLSTKPVIIKSDDRYSFEFNKVVSSGLSSYTITSSDKIDILDGKTVFKGHLITGSKWIDFEGPNTQAVFVNRINDYEVEVTVIQKAPSKRMVFNSIGELNCVTQSSNFLSINSSTTHEKNQLSGESQILSLRINRNTSYASSVSATAEYNGTNYSMTPSTNATHYLFNSSINTPVTLISSNKTVRYHFTYNNTNYQTGSIFTQLHSPTLTSCTSGITAFNFTQLDEQTLVNISGNISYVFNYGTANLVKTLNGTSNDKQFHMFCMSPVERSFSTNATIQYVSAGYSSRQYTNTSLGVTNITSTIPLYSLLSGSGTNVQLTVKDPQDNKLQNILVEAYKFETSTNSDILVESLTTDPNGNVIFSLDTGTNKYSFKFYQNNNLVLQTTRFILFTSSYEYIIGSSPTAPIGNHLKILNGVRTNITYNNQTLYTNFSWDSRTDRAEFFCYEVTDFNQSYHYSCSSDNSSSIGFTLPAGVNTTFLLRGYINDTGGVTHTIKTLTVNLANDLKNLDIGSRLFISIIIILLFGLLVVRVVQAVPIALGFGLFITKIFGLLPLSNTATYGVIGMLLIISYVLWDRL